MPYKDRATYLAYQSIYAATHVEAQRTRNKKYKKTHRTKVLAARRKRYQVRKEELQTKAVARYWRNPESRRVYTRTYTKTNVTKVKAARKSHYDANKEILNAKRARDRESPTVKAREAAQHAVWVKAHPEKNNAILARRRAAKASAAINDLSATQWEEIKQACGHRCAYCDRKMQRLTKDHITPVSKRGNNTVQNIVPACRSCNSKKHAGPPLKPVQPLLLTVAESKPYVPRKKAS